jgi:CubicO group peptidase (beta-lactamase class C family)
MNRTTTPNQRRALRLISALFIAVLSSCGDSGGESAAPRVDAKIEARIEAVLAASLVPGALTPSTPDVPPEALPSGASVGIRIPDQPDILIGAGTEVGNTTGSFDPRRIFKAGPTSLNITRAIALMLIDEGALLPGDAIGKWLPTYPNANSITVDMLINGNSGMTAIANWDQLVVADFARTWTFTEVLAEAAKAPPGTPGTTGDDETATAALAFILEQVSGKPLSELYQSRVLGPLGMTSTTFLDPAHLPANFSHGVFNLDGAAHNTSEFPLDSFESFRYGYSGLQSDLSDQLTLIEALGRGSIPALHREPTPDHFPVANKPDPGEPYVAVDYPINAYCPCTETAGGVLGTALGRRAAEPGSRTQLYYFPETKISIAIHYNGIEAGTDQEIQQVAYDVYTVLTGRSIEV